MCGIAGIYDPHGVDRAHLQAMVDILAHRGPDDSQVHVEPGVGLGFRRLSIIDLESGAQPIPNEDGSVRVICNGEIYNYQELRGALQHRGHRFSTRSDAEVLVHLYEERGPQLLRELRGMFAFAIWDRTKRRLLLARDHLGQKPLYWAQDGPRLYFASEIKGILAVSPRYRRMDPLALDEYFSLRVISEPRSMFEGIRKLAAADYLTVSEQGLETHRYWELDFEPKKEISEAEALDRAEHHVREAVQLHLVSDVPVGAFLSGGVDSALIASMVSQVHGGTFDTFSMGLRYGSFDETPAAREIAELLGTRHHERWIDGGMAHLLADVVYHADEPSDPLSVCMYQLAEFARADVKVALGGDGGDELFGGYDRYFAVPYLRYYAALPAAVRVSVLGRLFNIVPDGFWYKSLRQRLLWAHELAQQEGGSRYARGLGYFYFTPRFRDELYTPKMRERTAGFDPDEAVVRWHDDDRLKELLDRMVLADYKVRLPNHSVMILDRMTMAHGLEARSPFLDHRLAEFAALLPSRLKIRNRERRWLQKQLARKYLPPGFVDRPKQGFASALPYMMKREFELLFRKFLSASRIVEAGWLRSEPIQQLLTEHLTGRIDHGARLWLLVNAELWHRLHVENTSVDELRGQVSEALDGGSAPYRVPDKPKRSEPTPHEPSSIRSVGAIS